MDFCTNVPLRAIWAPAVLTRARATLPKLPSPISFNNSNLSSNPNAEVEPLDDPRGGNSCEKVMITVLVSLLKAVKIYSVPQRIQVRPLNRGEKHSGLRSRQLKKPGDSKSFVCSAPMHRFSSARKLLLASFDQVLRTEDI